MKRVMVNVAWPYVNGEIHPGHLAGYLVPSDIIARYHRLAGDDVLMVSGSDCYGTPTTVQADKEGISPGDVVKKYHKAHRVDLFRHYGLSYNLYTKTTTKIHKKVVHDMFLDLLKNGYITKGVMKQYYSVSDKQFLPDRYVEGICPHCNAKDQRSDQCESCGRWLEDGELINPKSKLTGAKVILKDTEHYFLAFDKLEGKLRGYLKTKKGVWKKWVWAEADGWLREGLKRRAITRDLDWGISLPLGEIKKLPRNKQLSDYTGKRIYVWWEAVIGYISATKEWSKRVSGDIKGDDSEVIFSHYKGQSKSWREFWLNKNALHYYFMGQDNLVFHTLMWPAQLIGSKNDYTLPKYVVVNKFMNYEGKKFSKSRNWTIDLWGMAKEFGVDPIRYYISANLPENKEGNFTWKEFVSSVNNELVANIGNFIHRTLTFAKSRFKGRIPEGKLEKSVQFEIKDAFVDAGELLEQASITEALQRIMKFVSFANKYFDRKQVWSVVKEDKKLAGEILFNCIQLVDSLRILLMPYLPHAMERLSTMLNAKTVEPQVGKKYWKLSRIKSGERLVEIKPLFNKLDMKEVEEKKKSLGSS